MFRDQTSTKYYHAEYVRRHVSIPDPLERSRQDLRRAIGHGLIHLGERLARVVDDPRKLDEAA